MQSVIAIEMHHASTVQHLGFVRALRLNHMESIAGRMAFATFMVSSNLRAVALYRKYVAGFYLSTPQGFPRHMVILLFLKDRVNWWLGLECKTWVWHARTLYGFSRMNPRGDDNSNNPVLEAYMVVGVAVLVITITTLRGATWIIEQPRSSLMDITPEVSSLFRYTRAHNAGTAHGAFFGGESMKSLKLMGTPIWLRCMHRGPTRYQLSRFQNLSVRHGGRVTGIKRQLEEHDHCSMVFGKAVADLFVGDACAVLQNPV